jgi:serine/threonine protein kinase
MFGAYRIVRRIGVGGMAETFLAVRRGPGAFEQRVCLKRVLPAFEADQRFIQQFMEEATIAASLRHSNIVGVIDFGQVDGTHFMALELVDGVDLRALVRSVPGEKLSPELVTLIATELAQALLYAHNQTRRGVAHGIVHRDISPANVLVSYAGEVKLADFGIAKAMRSSGVTASGAVKGKVPYMSPEQARGETLDGRSDLFAMGVLMYELLCGVRPFDGDSDVQTLTRILSGEFRPILDENIAVPAPLAAIVEGLLVNEASKRIASAEALLSALGDLPSPPITARLELGRLSKRARPPETLNADEMRAVLAEAGIGRAPEPTAVLTSRSAPPPPLVVSVAGPSDATRTRLPSAPPPPGAALAEITSPDAGLTPSGIDVSGAAKRPVHSETARRELAMSGAATPTTGVTKQGIGRMADPRDAGPGVTEDLAVPAGEMPSAHRPRSMIYAAFGILVVVVVVLLGAVWFLPRAATDRNGAAAAAPPTPVAPSGAPSAPPASPDIVPAPVPVPPTPAVPAADAAVARLNAPGEDVEKSEEAAAPTASADRARETRHRNGRVRISVAPWGKVWIDGKYMGRAPVNARLPAGAHEVGAGYEVPTEKRTLTLRAGENPPVLLELPTQ